MELEDPTGPFVLGSMAVGGFYFNENEKLLKGFNWGSDSFLFFKDHSCCGKQGGCCSVSLRLAGAVAVGMQQSRRRVSGIFWRWNQKYLLTGLAVERGIRMPSGLWPKPWGLLVLFASWRRLGEEQVGGVGNEFCVERIMFFNYL